MALSCNEVRDRARPIIAIAGLLALALAARIWGAWSLRFSTDSDTGIVYLMVQHMLEGTAWPVFFYGQAYMGNVEPAFSAAGCALSHYSPFQVNLGTALLGWMALIVLARWARDAVGPRGSIWALLIAFIGPPTFYGFQVSPRGGYAVTVLLGTLLVWWICRITLEERRTAQVRPGVFFVWGFLAGLGWWANSLILPSLLTSALIILLGLGRSLWKLPRFLAGSAGFFIGSAPFWFWSFRHQGDSLTIFQSVDPAAFGRRGIELFTQRLPDFFEFHRAGSPLWFLGLLLVLLPPLIALIAAVRDRKNPQSLYVAAAVLQTAILLACYCATRFADTGLVRYLVPLFIPWVLLTTVALHTLARRVHPAVAWILALLLSAGYLHILPDFGDKAPREARKHLQARRLQEFCLNRNLPIVYTGFRHHWLNASLNENPLFITLAGERLLPNARKGEETSSPAILNREGFIDEFLQQTGGEAHCSPIPDTPWSLHWNFVPPPEFEPLSDPTLIVSARNSRNADLLEALTDSNLDTTRVLGDSLEPETWTFHFKAPVSLAGLRLYLDPPDALPPPLSIEAVPDSDSTWKPLTGDIAPTHYFWAGPRPYWGGRSYHFALQWPTTKISALRIHFPPQPHPKLVHIAELQFLGCPSESRFSPELQEDFIRDLIEFLQTRKPDVVYADRWVSARLADSHGSRPPAEPAIGWDAPIPERQVVKWTSNTVLVVARDQAALTQKLLTDQSIVMRRTPLGAWEIFDFSPADGRPEGDTYRGFIWTGRGILRGNQLAQTAPPEQPALTTPIHFRNGARLRGLSPASPLHARAGSSLHLRYFWECPPPLDPHAYAVFAHFHSGSTVFQDDHLWLAPFRPAEIRNQTRSLLFPVDREIPIPADLPPGTYHLRIGLLESKTGKRVPCKTDFPSRHDAVELPVQIRVGSHQDP